jgi:hypothetical protein
MQDPVRRRKFLAEAVKKMKRKGRLQLDSTTLRTTKSDLEPSQVVNYLGIKFDSRVGLAYASGRESKDGFPSRRNS